MDTITALVLMFFLSCLTVTMLYLIRTIFSSAFLLDIQFSSNRLSIAWAEPYSAITYPDALPFPASSPSPAEPFPIEESPASEIHWPDHPTWDDFTAAPNEPDSHSEVPSEHPSLPALIAEIEEAHALCNHDSGTPPPT